MSEEKEKIQQEWYCDACYESGFVPMEEHEDAWSVIQKIITDHRNVSPKCIGKDNRVRVVVRG